MTVERKANEHLSDTSGFAAATRSNSRFTIACRHRRDAGRSQRWPPGRLVSRLPVYPTTRSPNGNGFDQVFMKSILNTYIHKYRRSFIIVEMYAETY